MGLVEEERGKELAEVERLRNILRKVGAREKLNGIRENVWREGSVRELVARQRWIGGNVAELRLVADYVYLDRRDGRTDLHDLLYPNDAGGVHYQLGYSDRVAVLTIGAASVHLEEDIREDVAAYIYVGFKTHGLSVWGKKSKEESFGSQDAEMKFRPSVNDLAASRFIDTNLLKLTRVELLPNTLRHHNRPRLM